MGAHPEDGRPDARERAYSTVTDFARLRGWSTLQPRANEAWYEMSWSGTMASSGAKISGVAGT
jgi:hypothetical protein